nr:hypothetical protein [Tanacetum cinerariifolium]
MSDSKDFTVTYTEVSSPFEGLSGIGSLGVEGPPMMPMDPYAYVVAAFQAPPSPDYVPGPEEPEQAPPLPKFVPDPVYPEFMPLEDEILPTEEQPLPAADSPTADSSRYIPKSDHVEDPKEDPADYLVNRDDDDDEEESSGDEVDDEEEDKDEDEEEHPASADSIPPPPVHHTTARISILVQSPIPFWSEAEIDRLLAIPSPPPSPLSPWSSPLPQIPSPPLPAESRSTIYFPFTTIECTTIRDTTTSTIPLPTSSLTLLLPSTSHSVDVPEVTLPPRKRLCIALGTRYKVGESSSAATARPTGGFRVDYGFVATLDDEIRRDSERGRRMTEFVTTVRQDTDEIYVRLDDSQDDKVLMSGVGTAGIVCRIAGSRPHTTDTASRESGTKKTTGSTPATKTTTTTSVIDAQLKALIDQGVANVLVVRNADRCRNGEDIHDSGMGARRQAPPARECTYQDFMKCKPLYFKGTEGVVELTQWFERMETVFRISSCTVENQIKFATCTLLGSALTTAQRGEIKKLEAKLWNLKVKGTDVVSYSQHFQEMALMCARMFPEESDKVERYISGLPDMIHKSVMASKPKTMQNVIEFTTELMDKKFSSFAERQAENKRKFEDTSKNNQNQQQNKKQNTGRAYTAGSGEKKPYGGSKTLCSKCNYHHDAQGHFKRECPKLKNNNLGNPIGNGNAPAKVYAVGHTGTNPGSNVITGTFLLNNRYASILFYTGADRSFVSTAFSSQIDITPTTLDNYYDVKLADGRIIGLNTIIRGFTLNFLNHPFNIDLMPVELGSFDVIIGMDWLAKYKVVIVCAEKIVRIPWGNETLIVRSNGSDLGNKTR